MLVKIKCPCGAESSLSLLEPRYKGPFRCWKCRNLFTISLQDGEVKSFESLSQEEFDRQQAEEALKAKSKKNRRKST